MYVLCKEQVHLQGGGHIFVSFVILFLHVTPGRMRMSIELSKKKNKNINILYNMVSGH